MSGLSDYLNSLNRDGWSTRRISAEADRHGHKLSNATASRYLSGKHGAPGQDIIDAFAAVFSVSPDSIRDAAGMPGLGQPFDLGPDASRLTGPQRDVIRTTVRLFVEQNDALARDAERDGAMPDFYALAARRAPRGRDALDAEADAAGEESQER